MRKNLFKFLLVLTVMFTMGVTNIFADSTGVVTASKLNVRKGPSTKYSRIGSLYKNKSVTILEESNGWYKINLNGKEGWVSKQYIKKTGQSTSNNSSVDNNDSQVVRTMSVVASAYTGYSTTSTGQKPVWGTIAVDPKVIPYGTKVYIPQFGRTFIANNTGGAIKGNKIDIFMNTKKECYNWGRKTIEIQILG
ncbi:3D domain-containing protein [Romboutsia sp. 13368]|uniref:3D domain-containing protein n=1 Tax=Romboutsia sp. 13368 TaxID=2708053 RepID=UPI0025EE81CB|nr:3D domain-containing protein [Romboutsia sp. 13368]